MKYPPVDDLMVRAVPCPWELDNRSHTMLVLRVRAREYISTAALHVSCDGESYLQIYDSLDHVIGGTLLAPLDDSPEPIEVGPLIRILGPDAGTLRVLSMADWALGRMPLLIGDEWCYLRQLEADGGGRYRLRGILRGQMGSKVATHPHGADAYLADARMLQPIRDSAVRLGELIWVKTQPVGSEALPLTYATARVFDLPPCYTPGI